MTLTVAHRFFHNSYIFSRMSKYFGSVIFSVAGRLSHSCNPRNRSASWGISWCRMPRPAVIHWLLRGDQALVAQAVFMRQFTLHQVRDRLDPTVWVHRKSTDIVGRIVGIKRIEHQERVKISNRISTQYACQLHPAPSTAGTPLTTREIGSCFSSIKTFQLLLPP